MHKLGEYPGNNVTEKYNDDIYVGYRYYDTYKVEPQFAFGYGLSYTDFEYSNIKAKANNQNATVTFTIKNTGQMAGAEVAQVYVRQEKSTLPRPEKELKAFQKIFLKPGEKKEITISLNEDAFKYYDDKQNKWVLEPGMFDIIIGSSSRLIRATEKISL